MTSRKDRTHIRPQPEDVMGDGLGGLKDARFSPLFDAGKFFLKLCEFSNDKGTLLFKKFFFHFYHHTLPLKMRGSPTAQADITRVCRSLASVIIIIETT